MILLKANRKRGKFRALYYSLIDNAEYIFKDSIRAYLPSVFKCGDMQLINHTCVSNEWMMNLHNCIKADLSLTFDFRYYVVVILYSLSQIRVKGWVH